VFEPLANAVNWVDLAGVQPGDTVVIEGPGHQGLAVLEAVLVAEPSVVIVTGTSQDALRLDAAMAMGATATVMVDVDDAGTVVRDLTRGHGADVVFDIASVVHTVPMAIELVKFRGRILLAGLKHFEPVPGFVSDLVVLKGLSLFGGSGFTPESMAGAVQLIADGKAHLDVMAGEVFDLDHVDEAMALLARTDPTRDAVRVTLVHS
jgi:threonine dehydrogenase-like Zn-dependent dehydrogenase